MTDKESKKMVWIDAEVYNLIRQKKIEIWEKDKEDISIQDIATKAVENGITSISLNTFKSKIHLNILVL